MMNFYGIRKANSNAEFNLANANKTSNNDANGMISNTDDGI